MPIGKLVERVDQQHDPVLTGVLPESCGQPLAQAIEIALRFLPFLLLFRRPCNAAPVEFVQQALDERVSRRRALRDADEMRDEDCDAAASDR